MRNVSNEYINTMNVRRDFYPAAEITFQDGTKKNLTKDDFELSGNSIVEAAGTSSFPLGIVVSKQVSLSITNYDGQWSEYDFYYAKILLRIKFDLDSGKTETLNIGTFTVITPETYGTVIDITAVDDSYKLDREYDTTLSFPLAAGEAVRDSCTTCGVSILTSTFNNSNFVIGKKPENLTHRQFIGLCAMIAGGNAKFDEYNRLKIITYDFSEFEKSGLDGGSFDNSGTDKYVTGDNADGGTFRPWNTGYNYDGGAFGDRRHMHILYQFKSGLKIEVDDVVITGVQLTDSEKNVYLYGKTGYVLPLENQLASGKEAEVAQMIGQKVAGLRFRPFVGDLVAYPMAEFMDLAVIIDYKSNVYHAILTDIDFQFFGFTTLKCAADSPIRNSSKYYGNEVRAIVEASRLVEKEKTEREKALEKLAEIVSQSSGLYMTEDEQGDGSTVFYMHNKPTLSESDIVWKMTEEAFAVSTDGGKTWNAGLTVDGDLIANILSATGVSADWINAGEMLADRIHGGTLRVGGANNIDGEIEIRDSKGEIIGSWKNSGFMTDGDYFAVDELGAMYSNNPVIVGYLNMAVTVSGMLDVAYAEQKKAMAMAVSATTSTSMDSGEYTLMIGDLDSFSKNPWKVKRVTVYGGNGISLYGPVGVSGDFTVGSSYTKSKEALTENYGSRLLYCYEMPSPMFGDIGEGETDENGECYIDISDIFSETISTDIEYHVFLQKEGGGDIWVAEKKPTYFLVKGTGGIRFSWELKAKQKGFEYERLESYPNDARENVMDDYESGYMQEIKQLILEREELLYESVK